MRKARMTDNMLEVLSEKADITRDILLKILLRNDQYIIKCSCDQIKIQKMIDFFSDLMCII